MQKIAGTSEAKYLLHAPYRYMLLTVVVWTLKCTWTEKQDST